MSTSIEKVDTGSSAAERTGLVLKSSMRSRFSSTGGTMSPGRIPITAFSPDFAASANPVANAGRLSRSCGAGETGVTGHRRRKRPCPAASEPRPASRLPRFFRAARERRSGRCRPRARAPRRASPAARRRGCGRDPERRSRSPAPARRWPGDPTRTRTASPRKATRRRSRRSAAPSIRQAPASRAVSSA